jgi:hypothetical protein
VYRVLIGRLRAVGGDAERRRKRAELIGPAVIRR